MKLIVYVVLYFGEININMNSIIKFISNEYKH